MMLVSLNASEGGENLSKNEVVLQLTLKVLENFSYNVNDFGGNTLQEHAKINAELVATIYNEIYNSILEKQL